MAQPPMKNSESKESKGIHAEFQFIMAAGLLEVDSGMQRHEAEKVLTMQC